MSADEPDVHGDVHARGARHDFAVNVVAAAPPPWLRAALQHALDHDAAAYPDETRAVAAVAERHGRAPEEVVLLNGAAQGFGLLADVLQPARPVAVHPQFSEPERTMRTARATLAEPWHLEDRPDVVPADADLVVLGNPTNPTGVLHPAAAVRRLARPGRTLVVDEAFMDFVAGEPETLAQDTTTPGLVVLRSLTKLLGIPGIRAGYLLAPPELAARLRRRRPAWSVNALALAAIEAAMGHPEHAHAIAAQTALARRELVGRLESIAGVRVHAGAANFLLLELPDARRAVQRLKQEHGVAVRPAWTFPGLGADHVRVAVRGAPADDALVAAVASVLTTAGGRSPAPFVG
ncbi:Rv2231c family pyridoxal phosphate-dependent protein CobC [Conexibacter sp. SYSU D00693]|uniref:Rv2231c family pyridoxal phosphate-dependent protein CobC n=1 Tax=Conexibacter sp. SYSU D00693 TaxID=2812560 RepID=UPI00196B1CE5|nr:Rv2231c family pyridoxal phosphate-dependent protein CobC [Conexibacter sp. SYSU D00693]